MTETPICKVMIGLPACGKSTIINKIKSDDCWVYSTDMYIEEVAKDHGITYSEAFEANIKAATEFNDRHVKEAMKLGKPVLWDQTNLGAGKRRKIVNLAKENGYRVEAHVILKPKQTDVGEWQRRLLSREGKNIPTNVLLNMIESFVMPSKDEGFDEIVQYNMYGEVQ